MHKLRRYLSILWFLALATSTGAIAGMNSPLPSLEWMHEALRDGRFDQLEQAVAQAQAEYERDTAKESAVTRLLKSFAMPDPGLEDRLNAWVNNRPSYAAHAMRGIYRINIAHAWRGYGWSSNVVPARFEIMDRYLEGAYQDLEIATGLTAKPSFAFTRMIDIAKFKSRKDLARDILDQALKMDPYAVGPYTAYAALLVPRWGGSYDEMESLAVELEKTKHPKLLLLAREIRHDIVADRANMAEHNKDRLAALKGYQEANALLEKGDTLCELGRLYKVLGQLDNAMATLNRGLALEPDNGRCLFQRAELRLDARQPVEGIADLRRAAFFGHLTGARKLGIILFDGEKGVPINTEEGFNWLKRAAYFWDAEALFQVGLIYERGQGVPPNPKLASEYYRICAKLEDVRCETNLGMMLWYGKGIPADQDQAVRLWHRAAHKGAWQGGHNLNYFLSPTERIKVIFTLGPGMWASQLIGTLAALLIGGLTILWILLRRRRTAGKAAGSSE